MEIVIALDPDRARAAGYDHGVTLLWNHTRGGWEYGPAQHGRQLQYVADLITGAPVAEPTDIVRAARILLGSVVKCHVHIRSDARVTAAS